jgi:hypothetical protein
MIDQLTNFHFHHPEAVAPPMAVIGTFFPDGSVSVYTSSFVQSCPGGIAPEGAGAALVESCGRASAIGTRQGIIVQLLIFLWAATHYLLGSIGLTKLMREKQRERLLEAAA